MPDRTAYIPSYVIRTSRMSHAQKKAYAELSDRWVTPYNSKLLDWDLLFDSNARRIVEVGFGMGDATKTVAAAHPEWALLGIEVHKPGIGKLLWLIEQEKLKNIRIIEGDAVWILTNMLHPETVDAFHIWFPDPWPKKRHHKRRLLQEPVISLMHRALRVKGYIHVATDWEHYAVEVLNLLKNTAGLTNKFDAWAPKPDYRPLTKFEKRGVAAGRSIRDLIFEKELI